MAIAPNFYYVYGYILYIATSHNVSLNLQQTLVCRNNIVIVCRVVRTAILCSSIRGCSR